MKKIVGILICLVLIGIVPILSIDIVRSENQNYDFYDDFDDGDNNGWTVYQGDWQVVNKEYVYGYSGPTDYDGITTAGYIGWVDYTYQGKFKYTSGGTLQVYFIFRFGGYGGYNLYNGYCFQYDVPTTGWCLSKFSISGGNSIIATESSPSSPNIDQWYNIRIDLAGTHIKCYVDNNLKIDAYDSTYTTGSIGLRGDLSTIYFDNIGVSCVENNPPNKPEKPDPANHATGININADLSWTGGDPDSGDTVKYDVYFEAGDSTPDVLVSYSQSGVLYDPGTMDSNTKYYWNIIAKDNHGTSTTGPIWDFTTVRVNEPPTVDIIFPDEDDTVSGIVSINGTASDPNGNDTLTKVEVNIDNKTWNIATGIEHWTYNWSIAEETEGIHTIYARSFDGENYSDIFVVNVTVFNAKPEIIIVGISGGFGISANIKNIGTAPDNIVNWSIIVEKDIGIILSGEKTERTINELGINQTADIKSSNLKGIGWITITVQADDASKKATAFLLGPLVLRVNEI